jgi:1-acyl-sn-glycerol-3-phosphate acyltransferase
MRGYPLAERRSAPRRCATMGRVLSPALPRRSMSRLYRPKAGFWIRLCVAVIYPLDTVLFRMRWRCLDRVPPPGSGGVIIAMNHLSTVDTLLMARLVWQSGRVPRFLVKASAFRWPVIGRVLAGAGQIPVYRGTTDAASSLRAAVSALGRGEAVVIYPEGTTTKDPQNWPMLGKTGIARLVLACPDVPVIPVGQWGAHKRRTGWLRAALSRPEVVGSVGEPVDLRRFRGAVPSAEVLREITDSIMNAVRDEVSALRGEPAPEAFFRTTQAYVDPV